MLEWIVAIGMIVIGLTILLSLPVFAGWWKPFKGTRRGPRRWKGRLM